MRFLRFNVDYVKNFRYYQTQETISSEGFATLNHLNGLMKFEHISGDKPELEGGIKEAERIALAFSPDLEGHKFEVILENMPRPCSIDVDNLEKYCFSQVKEGFEIFFMPKQTENWTEFKVNRNIISKEIAYSYSKTVTLYIHQNNGARYRTEKVVTPSIRSVHLGNPTDIYWPFWISGYKIKIGKSNIRYIQVIDANSGKVCFHYGYPKCISDVYEDKQEDSHNIRLNEGILNPCGHVTCDKHVQKCTICGTENCLKCSSKAQCKSSHYYCKKHSKKCNGCNEIICKICEPMKYQAQRKGYSTAIKNKCKHLSCKKHTIKCDECENYYCEACSNNAKCIKSHHYCKEHSKICSQSDITTVFVLKEADKSMVKIERQCEEYACDICNENKCGHSTCSTHSIKCHKCKQYYCQQCQKKKGIIFKRNVCNNCRNK